MNDSTLAELTLQIKAWGHALGFQHIGISNTDLGQAEHHLLNWLAKGYHGEMNWMASHGNKRSRPAKLEPGTLSIISARMDYLPNKDEDLWAIINDGERAYVSRYALGRDYHKLLRKRLQQLADRMQDTIGEFGYRVFVDSAPVLEKPIAEKAGLGWIGKHTNLIARDAGSWFFLGEIYTDLPLPVDIPYNENHCGTCTACIEACPTGAIVAPYQVDARRCISYLTIEHPGSIPEALRPLLGNRIYGCDDCQLVCPWNRFATASQEDDFLPRHHLDEASLIELFAWDEQTFLDRMQGSPIRRIGYERWLRNIAVALGNAPSAISVIKALQNRRHYPSDTVQEHVHWALAQHQ